MKKTFYFINDDVDVEIIYGNEYPVCFDKKEYNRLINIEKWEDLPELVHKADEDEMEKYGYYDSDTGETVYGTIYGSKSPWAN